MRFYKKNKELYILKIFESKYRKGTPKDSLDYTASKTSLLLF